MNVRELLEKLQEFDPELPVGMTYAENYEGDEDDYWVQRFEITVDKTTVDEPAYGKPVLAGQPCILISPGY